MGDWAAMIGGLAYWLVFGVSLTVLCGFLRLILPKAIGQRVGRGCLHHLFRLFVKYLRAVNLVHADLSGIAALSRLKRPCIVAPNHTSLWDVVFLIACLPNGVCIMKRSILMNPLLGGGARLAQYVAADGNCRMIRSAIRSLQDGGQVLLFPEGTRTKPDARWINPLRGGCAIIAAHADVDVLPVMIRSDSRYLEKGWPLLRRPNFPIRMSFDLGEPLRVRTGETSQAFTHRLQHVFEQTLARPDPLRRKISPQAKNDLSAQA